MYVNECKLNRNYNITMQLLRAKVKMGMVISPVRSDVLLGDMSLKG